jgi:HEAT repeat protein
MECLTGLSMLGAAPTQKLADYEKSQLAGRLTNERDARVKIWVRVMLMLLDEKDYLTTANLQLLGKQVKDPDVQVGMQAAQALGALGPRAKSQVEVLLEAAKGKNLELAVVALGSLARIGDSTGAGLFSKILNDEKAEMALRVQAAQTAGGFGVVGKVLVDDLRGLLKHKEPQLVLAAVHGLAYFGPLAKAAYDNLLRLAEDSKEEAIRLAAAEAAKRVNDMPKK